MSADNDLFFRTEDIAANEVLDYFVETPLDRSIIDSLKSRNPVVLSGSRGVGKSFLLRVAEQELRSSFDTLKILPVYITFNKSSLVVTNDPQQFQHWMLAKICTRIVRTLKQYDLLTIVPNGLSILTGTLPGSSPSEMSRVESIAEAYEKSWLNPKGTIDLSGLPSVESLRDAIEDLLDGLGVKRISLLIDEAAHILRPEQQRQFFTLFRDLRTPYISCNAAVYPGVTAYGETFQPTHDATMMSLDRDFLTSDYVATMKRIVEKQASSRTLKALATYGESFAILAYAASGNPRILLKTLMSAPGLRRQEINEIIRSYYRTDIWSEHSLLPEKYSGHKPYIDWGRNFLEDQILPALKRRNDDSLKTDGRSSCYFWIHRDAPTQVKEALRLLSYTGIVIEAGSGMRATRSEVGTRYAVNLGCLFAMESTPSISAFKIATRLDLRRMPEYGQNHTAYDPLLANVLATEDTDPHDALTDQLQKSVNRLDLTNWQKEKLAHIGLDSIGKLLQADEPQLQRISYIGPARSRRIRNSAFQAVFEYLSG